jgi:hypothetical protein
MPGMVAAACLRDIFASLMAAEQVVDVVCWRCLGWWCSCIPVHQPQYILILFAVVGADLSVSVGRWIVWFGLQC